MKDAQGSERSVRPLSFEALEQESLTTIGTRELCLMFQLSHKIGIPLALGLVMAWILGVIGKHAILGNIVHFGVRNRSSVVISNLHETTFGQN